MTLLQISRTAFFILLIAIVSAAKDKPSYQQGTITGWDTRVDVFSAGNGQTIRRRVKVYNLKGPGLIYEIDECGAFQAGQFTAGQAVDFRVDEADPTELRLYVRRENGKEYKCKLDGEWTLDSDKASPPDAQH